MHATSVLPGERFVTGPFGDVGYIAKRPGHGAHMDKILEVRAQNRVTVADIKKRVRDSKRVAVSNIFYKRFDEVSLRASVNRMVELGMKEEAEYFRIKQNKLRKLLIEDQSRFAHEYARKAQSSTEEMLAREHKKANEIVRGKFDGDKLRAQEIYTKMTMRNSDEFKEKLRIANLKHFSEGLEEQIRLKKYQERLEHEEEAVWDAVRESDCRKSLLQKVLDTEAAAEAKREFLASLNKQVMDEDLRRKKMDCIDTIEEEKNEEVRREWKEQLSKRDEDAVRRNTLHRKALIKQIETNRLLAERRMQEEIRIELIMQEDKRKKAEREAAEYKSNKMNAWNELVVFKESMVQSRNAAAALEQETERIFEERQKMYNKEMRETRKAMEKARRDRIVDCAEYSKRMALENAKKQAELKAMDFKRRDLAIENKAVCDRLEVILEDRNKVDRRAYNNAQTKYMSLLEERQRLEDEEMLTKMRSLSEENARRVKATLERPMAEIVGTSIHPFYHVVKAHRQ
ncbi:hypothetical protein GE061_004352 [Apolygus lucorum]|uniref:Trichohyalin-plectin-homology domain-containing protein n=1 Tax=Apolygus lucorum TaxID=248454 RepID=A0A6A4IXY5_APOLU|nr:hypothetical protein GE061_004352 [Apolygus lucorum]